MSRICGVANCGKVRAIVRRYSVRIAVGAVVIVGAYIGSFPLVMKVPQGTKSVIGGPMPKATMFVYASRTSHRLNTTAYLFYYPLIRIAEETGLMQFISEPTYESDSPCLYVYLARQK